MFICSKPFTSKDLMMIIKENLFRRLPLNILGHHFNIIQVAIVFLLKVCRQCIVIILQKLLHVSDIILNIILLVWTQILFQTNSLLLQQINLLRRVTHNASKYVLLYALNASDV